MRQRVMVVGLVVAMVTAGCLGTTDDDDIESPVAAVVEPAPSTTLTRHYRLDGVIAFVLNASDANVSVELWAKTATGDTETPFGALMLLDFGDGNHTLQVSETTVPGAAVEAEGQPYAARLPGEAGMGNFAHIWLRNLSADQQNRSFLMVVGAATQVPLDAQLWLNGSAITIEREIHGSARVFGRDDWQRGPQAVARARDPMDTGLTVNTGASTSWQTVNGSIVSYMGETTSGAPTIEHDSFVISNDDRSWTADGTNFADRAWTLPPREIGSRFIILDGPSSWRFDIARRAHTGWAQDSLLVLDVALPEAWTTDEARVW